MSSKFDPDKVLPLLKQELEKAKGEKNFEKAGELRNQIWIVNDLSKGVKTAIPDSDLRSILNNLPGFNDSKPCTEKKIVPLEDKQLKTLRKKLKQIDEIKAKQAKGEKLQPQQLTKLQTEDQIREEIKELETLAQSILCSKSQ